MARRTPNSIILDRADSIETANNREYDEDDDDDDYDGEEMTALSPNAVPDVLIGSGSSAAEEEDDDDEDDYSFCGCPRCFSSLCVFCWLSRCFKGRRRRKRVWKKTSPDKEVKAKESSKGVFIIVAGLFAFTIAYFFSKANPYEVVILRCCMWWTNDP